MCPPAAATHRDAAALQQMCIRRRGSRAVVLDFCYDAVFFELQENLRCAQLLRWELDGAVLLLSWLFIQCHWMPINELLYCIDGCSMNFVFLHSYVVIFECVVYNQRV